MTISELQRTARDGQRFYCFAVKGVRYLCRWINFRRGLFELLEREGKPLKEPLECNVKGAPDARVELIATSGEVED